MGTTTLKKAYFAPYKCNPRAKRRARFEAGELATAIAKVIGVRGKRDLKAFLVRPASHRTVSIFYDVYFERTPVRTPVELPLSFFRLL